MLCQIVHLEVLPEKLNQFLEATGKNANLSVSTEIGCVSFDVVQHVDNRCHFLLYEVYRDEAAIQAHRETPHFAEWRRIADFCIVGGTLSKAVYQRHYGYLKTA